MGAACWVPGEPLPHVQASRELRDHLTEQGWGRDTAQAVEHLVRRAANDLMISAGEVRPHLQAAMARLMADAIAFGVKQP